MYLLPMYLCVFSCFIIAYLLASFFLILTLLAEALVEYDYKAQELDELTIKKGDIITNISFKPGGWWEGTLLNGKRGMFPDNFVKVSHVNPFDLCGYVLYYTCLCG